MKLTVTEQDVEAAINSLSPAEKRYRENNLKPKYHKPILLENKTMLERTQKPKTDVATKTQKPKTVIRKINGNEKKLTIIEAVKHDMNNRLSFLNYQFELLGKYALIHELDGAEKLMLIDNLETTICSFYDEAMNKLNAAKAVSRTAVKKTYIE